MDGKPYFRQVIVVEGRDDTAAVLRAVDAATIETHGYGISAETWKRLEAAYEKNGLIIFTDPDHAGEEIRRRVGEKFPLAAHAYLSRSRAEKKGDIGIENARPEDIADALLAAHTPGGPDESGAPAAERVAWEDVIRAGLSGRPDSASRREKVGSALGIGYANAEAMLRRMNALGVSKSDFEAALRATDRDGSE